MINPVSLPDLSSQVSLILLEAIPTAERLDGATGVVAFPAWRGNARLSVATKNRKRIGTVRVAGRQGVRVVVALELMLVDSVVRLFINGGVVSGRSCG